MNRFFFIIAISFLLLIYSCHRSIDRTIRLFGINLCPYNYTIIDKYERWAPNGDGELYAIISLNKIKARDLRKLKNQMISNGARSLPIKECETVYSSKVKQYVVDNTLSGLYIIQVDKYDNRDYNLLVYDEEKQHLVIHIRVK